MTAASCRKTKFPASETMVVGVLCRRRAHPKSWARTNGPHTQLASPTMASHSTTCWRGSKLVNLVHAAMSASHMPCAIDDLTTCRQLQGRMLQTLMPLGKAG